MSEQPPPEGLRVERGPGWVRITGSGSFVAGGMRVTLQGSTFEVKVNPGPTETFDFDADLPSSRRRQRRRYERLRSLMQIDGDEPFEIEDLDRFD